MREKKNNKGLIWLIVILIVLVLGLVGYVIYDKLLKIDKVIPNDDNTSTTTITTTTNLTEENNDWGMYKIINDNTSFPKENDESVIKLELNADNKELLKTYTTKQPIIETRENYDVKYLCIEVGEYFGETEGCLAKTVDFNDIVIDETDETLTCGHSEYYLYKNYIIVANVHGCNSGCYYDLKIFNLDTKKQLLNTEKGFFDDNYFKIYDNKIYYLTINKELKFDEYKEPNYVEYGYNYYDLLAEENVNVKNFEGEYDEQL